MHAWADPRSGAYVSYPVNSQCRYAQVELAHRWGMPVLGGSYGTESAEPGTWQAAAEVALDPLLVGLAGAEMVTGIGLNRSYTLLYPEAIILDDELYHRARHALTRMTVDSETLALNAIHAVGPGNHYLAQPHTRTHMRTAMEAGLTHQASPQGGYRDPVEVAREKVAWILDHHCPEPLEAAKQAELARILEAAGRELGA
jgi:trimethylamine--corrinoid protein Co-methyltransferase